MCPASVGHPVCWQPVWQNPAKVLHTSPDGQSESWEQGAAGYELEPELEAVLELVAVLEPEPDEVWADVPLVLVEDVVEPDPPALADGVEVVAPDPQRQA